MTHEHQCHMNCSALKWPLKTEFVRRHCTKFWKKRLKNLGRYSFMQMFEEWSLRFLATFWWYKNLVKNLAWYLVLLKFFDHQNLILVLKFPFCLLEQHLHFICSLRCQNWSLLQTAHGEPHHVQFTFCSSAMQRMRYNPEESVLLLSLTGLNSFAKGDTRGSIKTSRAVMKNMSMTKLSLF